jgi:hypothetical protein
MPAVAAVQEVEPLFFTSTSPLGDDRVPGGEEVPGDDAGVAVTVVNGVGVGVTAVSSPPPQLNIGTNKTSASNRVNHLRILLYLVMERPPIGGMYLAIEVGGSSYKQTLKQQLSVQFEGFEACILILIQISPRVKSRKVKNWYILVELNSPVDFPAFFFSRE